MAEVWRRLTSLLSTSSPSCSILTRSYDVATLENGGCSPCNSANCATLPLNTSADGSRGKSPAARNRRRDYRSHVEDWRVWLVIAIILSALIALILYAVLLPILRHQSHDSRSGKEMNEEYTTPFTLTRDTSSQTPPTTFPPPPKASRVTVEPVVFFENRLEAIFPTLGAESTSRVVATMEKGEKWGKTEAATNITPVPKAIDPHYPASSSAFDEEDEDDLFWMKLPPKGKLQSTQSMAGSTTTPLEMGEKERKRIVDEELKQVIASLESDHGPPPSTIDYSVVKGSKVSGEGIDDIKPVEILFTPPLGDTGEKESTPSSNTNDVATAGEPVWRRLPPPADPHDNSSHHNSPPSPPASPRVTDSPPIKEAFKVSAFLAAPRSTITDDPRRNAPIVVTALLDIGRGEWLRFTRHFDQYLDYFKMLFRLDNFMIIYCDAKVSEFLRSQTELDWKRIQLVEITLADLPFYRWRHEIQTILDNEQENWNEEWDKSVKEHPEALYADYNVLVNSKPYLLYNATQISKFAANGFFVWVDAGYGHGSAGAIPTGLWKPSLVPGKITLLQVTSAMEKIERYSLNMVYRKQKSVVSGGFMAGDVSAIKRLYVFFVKTFMDFLDIHRVDDDQTTLLMTIHYYHSTFNVLHGGWFDAFKLLPSQSN